MARLTLWLFVILLGLDLGAGVYEARIVVPLWASRIPDSLAAENPYGRVAIEAGMRFWAYMTPAVAAAAVLALVCGSRVPMPQRVWRTFAALCELAAVAMTLLYFRPTLVRLFLGHGGGLAPDAIRATVHRWVMWSRVRIAVSFVAWCAALHALSLS